MEGTGDGVSRSEIEVWGGKERVRGTGREEVRPHKGRRGELFFFFLWGEKERDFS